MKTLQSLRDIHAGRPGAVLGGGPSLMADLRHIPVGTVLISANHHGIKLVKANYMVFLDEPERFPPLLKAVQEFKGLKIGRYEDHTDVDLKNESYWDGVFTGHFATWLACLMGCDPVILCGMDLYQNPLTEDDNPESLAFSVPLVAHLQGWREAFTRCAHPERIRAMSGPLVEVFGKWSNT